jgi:hypothetical protein
MRCLITLLFALVSSSVYAQANAWSSAEICAAGGMSYFFLHSPPKVEQADANWYRIRSEAGNLYECSASGGRVSFRWINETSGFMTSESTTWSMLGDTLVVKTQLQEIKYERSGGAVREIN